MYSDPTASQGGVTQPATTTRTHKALCFALTAPEHGCRQWLPMLPAGRFSGEDGRAWTNDRPDGVLANMVRKIPFDFEHATEIKGPGGDAAPATGWVVQLENRSGEVWGLVEWNAAGQNALSNREYSFYSPAFDYDSTGRVISLSSVGLTNKPNLNVPALNRSSPLMKKLIAALGLPEGSSEEAVATAVTALKNHATSSTAAVDLTQFVPMETHQLALNRAQTAEQKLNGQEDGAIETVVDEAIAEGKIAPANRELYLGLCRSDAGLANFKSFVKTAPKVVDQQSTERKLPMEQSVGEMETALCRKMGITKEEFIKAREGMR